jgi:hypothetical protein
MHCVSVAVTRLPLGLPYASRWTVLFPVEILQLAPNSPASLQRLIRYFLADLQPRGRGKMS